MVKLIKRLNVLYQNYKNKKFEFMNSLHLYEILSILSIIFSGYIYYGDATMDSFITNCSFNIIKLITKEFIDQSNQFPSYFLKVNNFFYQFQYIDD